MLKHQTLKPAAASSTLLEPEAPSHVFWPSVMVLLIFMLHNFEELIKFEVFSASAGQKLEQFFTLNVEMFTVAVTPLTIVVATALMLVSLKASRNRLILALLTAGALLGNSLSHLGQASSGEYNAGILTAIPLLVSALYLTICLKKHSNFSKKKVVTFVVLGAILSAPMIVAALFVGDLLVN